MTRAHLVLLLRALSLRALDTFELRVDSGYFKQRGGGKLMFVGLFTRRCRSWTVRCMTVSAALMR